MFFSETFINILIYCCIAGVGIGATLLIALLIKDINSKKLW